MLNKKGSNMKKVLCCEPWFMASPQARVFAKKLVFYKKLVGFFGGLRVSHELKHNLALNVINENCE